MTPFPLSARWLCALSLLSLAGPIRAADFDKYLPDDTDGLMTINVKQALGSALHAKHLKKPIEDLLKKFHYLEVVMYLDEQNQDSYLTVLQEAFVPRAASVSGTLSDSRVTTTVGLCVAATKGTSPALTTTARKRRCKTPSAVT